jgi:hypothetical protein
MVTIRREREVDSTAHNRYRNLKILEQRLLNQTNELAFWTTPGRHEGKKKLETQSTLFPHIAARDMCTSASQTCANFRRERERHTRMN